MNMGFTKGIRIFALLLILSSLLPFGLAVSTFVQTKKFLATSAPAVAEVSALEEAGSAEGAILYAARFKFTDPKGSEVEALSRDSSSSPKLSVGDVVNILYDTSNPSDVRIDSWWGLWGASVFCLAFGFIDLVIGAVAFLSAPILGPLFNRKYK